LILRQSYIWYASSDRITPLDYAIAIGCIESIELLSAAGLSFNFRWSHCVANKALEPAVSNVLLRLFMQRYRELHEIGLEVLPKNLVELLRLADFEIFVSKARGVLEYLQRLLFKILHL